MSRVAPHRQARAFAPATVANLGLGFDILGLSIEGPGDTVLARRLDEPGVRIAAIRGDGGVLPWEPEKNTASIAAAHTLRRAGLDEELGVELEIDKGLPLGSGLGSSAASAAAAAMATNLLLGSPLRKEELVGACVEAEAAVSGRHADNVAPALLGGLLLVRSVEPLDLLRLPAPEGLTVVVVTPDLEVPTRAARRVLPQSVPLDRFVRHTANLAALVSACYTRDLAVLSRCIVDEVITPARTGLIPGSEEAIRRALDAGALGSSISGAGPSLFALCRSARSAADAAAAMCEAFAEVGLESTSLTSPIECPGARQV